MTAEIEGFEPVFVTNTPRPEVSPERMAEIEAEEAAAESDFVLGFETAAEFAIAFAEQLAPGRNGGKRMREHFDAIRAQAKV